MNIKNAYDPDNEDLLSWINNPLEWVSHPGDGWPESDWDDYVMNGRNDELVFQFANDVDYKNRQFFLHCLYYFVGTYFVYKKNGSDDIAEEKEKRLISFFKKVNEDSPVDITEWKLKTLDLLGDKIEFDSSFWFNYMFQNEINKLNSEQNADTDQTQ